MVGLFLVAAAHPPCFSLSPGPPLEGAPNITHMQRWIHQPNPPTCATCQKMLCRFLEGSSAPTAAVSACAMASPLRLTLRLVGFFWGGGAVFGGVGGQGRLCQVFVNR
jgi:hypothetical protein